MIAGIDIGTSYSSICVLDGSGKIKPVDIATGTSMFGSKYSLPSAVFVEDNGNVLVGQAAMNSRKRRPQNFRMEFKRDLGQDIPIVLGNSSFLPEDFYTELFRHMKASARKMSSESIETVCLTCPAAFGKKKREKVLKAAKAAGFFNVQLVDEPTAAAMSFKEDGVLSGRKKLLIYDFGGGTFDVSLLAYDNGRFSLMTEPSGLERCGGIDIDRMIFEDMQKCIDPEILASIAKDPKKAMRLNVQLSELAVKAKHHLSTASVYEEYIEVGMDDFEYTLTLDKLNTMIAGMVGQTIDVCRKVVEDAGIKVKDLSAILMVGGTSRVPLAQTMVKQMAAGVPVYCSADVDLAVGRGALMFAKSGERLENGSKSEKAGGAGKAGAKDAGAKTDVGGKAGPSVGDRQERNNVGNEAMGARNTETVSKQQLEQWFEMGRKYGFGEGVSVDYKEAVKWYRKAAEGGHAKAQNNLGVCYVEGKGVAKDACEAVKWFTKSAEQGYVQGQASLGVCYFKGDGVAQNYSEAARWWQKAAQQGDKNVQFSLAALYTKGLGVLKDDAEAAKWYRKAAESGHAKAQYMLGVCYDQGTGVSRNSAEAEKWYKKAAAQGNLQAQKELDKRIVAQYFSDKKDAQKSQGGGNTESNPERKSCRPANNFSGKVVIYGGTVIALQADGIIRVEDEKAKSCTKWNNIIMLASSGGGIIGLSKSGEIMDIGVSCKEFHKDIKKWRNVISVSYDIDIVLGLLDDGRVLASGSNRYGECNTESWRHVKEIACSSYHSVALFEDGHVAAVGANDRGQCNVKNWRNVKAIACGATHTVGLLEDGSVVAVGENFHGQCNVKEWKNVQAVACGSGRTVALLSDGYVVATGRNTYGECNVEEWSDMIAVFAGDETTAGIKRDGSIIRTACDYKMKGWLVPKMEVERYYTKRMPWKMF